MSNPYTKLTKIEIEIPQNCNRECHYTYNIVGIKGFNEIDKEDTLTVNFPVFNRMENKRDAFALEIGRKIYDMLFNT